MLIKNKQTDIFTACILNGTSLNAFPGVSGYSIDTAAVHAPRAHVGVCGWGGMVHKNRRGPPTRARNTGDRAKRRKAATLSAIAAEAEAPNRQLATPPRGAPKAPPPHSSRIQKTNGAVKTYQVDEGQEFPAASVGLVRRHVQGFVVTQDGEVGQQDGDPENLRGDERHDARAASASALPLPCCDDAAEGGGAREEPGRSSDGASS